MSDPKGDPNPTKKILGDGKVRYECTNCQHEVNEDGSCLEGNEKCYYCPDECYLCGHGYCDQSC